MAVQSIPGSWSVEKGVGGASVVFVDSGAGAGNTNAIDKSPGLIRVSPVNPGPGLNENWKLLGWTIDIALVWVSEPVLVTAHARMGKLWGGLAIDTQQSSQGGTSLLPVNPGYFQRAGRAQFPPDLSTFDVLWTQDDDVAIVPGTVYNWITQPLPSSVAPALIAKTFMFPSPISVRAGSQLQMQLVLTPSVYFTSEFVCNSGSWSVLYDDGAET